MKPLSRNLPKHQTGMPHRLTENDLKNECERLEKLLTAGELSPLESKRLEKVRRHLAELDAMKAPIPPEPIHHRAYAALISCQYRNGVIK